MAHHTRLYNSIVEYRTENLNTVERNHLEAPISFFLSTNSKRQSNPVNIFIIHFSIFGNTQMSYLPYFRHPKTTNEKRQNATVEHKDMVRTKRRPNHVRVLIGGTGETTFEGTWSEFYDFCMEQ